MFIDNKNDKNLESKLVSITPEKLARIDDIWSAAVALHLPLYDLFNDAEIVVMGDVLTDHRVESAHDRYAILYNRARQEISTDSDITNLELILSTLSRAIAENVSAAV